MLCCFEAYCSDASAICNRSRDYMSRDNLLVKVDEVVQHLSINSLVKTFLLPYVACQDLIC